MSEGRGVPNMISQVWGTSLCSYYALKTARNIGFESNRIGKKASMYNSQHCFFRTSIVSAHLQVLKVGGCVCVYHYGQHGGVVGTTPHH